MTVASSTNRISYSGDGSTTAFATSFVFLDDTDLQVYVDGVLKTLTTDYTVTGGDGESGTVTFVTAPASSTTVLIVRVVPLTQGVDYEEAGPFAAETHERALDKATMALQQLDEVDGRAIKLSITSDLSDIDFPEGTDADNRAGKVVGWDGDGEELTLYTVQSTDFANPVTTQGDLVQGGAAGVAERLAVGARGAILRVASTLKASWLALGASGKYLKSDGNDPAWGEVTTVQESGGQVLGLGAVADGQFLKRNSTTLVGASVLESGTPASVIGSRAIDTVYQNTSGKMRRVWVGITTNSGAGSACAAQVGSANPPTITLYESGNTAADVAMRSALFLMVPNNWYYRIASSGTAPTIGYWVEMDE